MRRALLAILAAATAILATSSTAGAHSAPPAVNQPLPSTIELAACPLLGTADYGDTWGDARSGGRRHEGVDMEADRGSPVLAVRDGFAEFKQSRLGGNAIWLATATGERFYYAHLDAWEGTSRDVTAGEVIGYVGQTGNARGNHLHFETRLGDQAVNPYPPVRAACTAESPVSSPSPSPSPSATALSPRPFARLN
jgi:murein DD-endopeptidase MepM/ murein hydrolase activator NlpD